MKLGRQLSSIEWAKYEYVCKWVRYVLKEFLYIFPGDFTYFLKQGEARTSSGSIWVPLRSCIWLQDCCVFHSFVALFTYIISTKRKTKQKQKTKSKLETKTKAKAKIKTETKTKAKTKQNKTKTKTELRWSEHIDTVIFAISSRLKCKPSLNLDP